MIEILSARPHVAAFRLAGTLSGDDYDRCIAEIDAKLADRPRIAVYCDLADMSGMDPRVVPKDLRYVLGRFGEFHRFARGAVVTGQDWLARIGSLSGMLLPHTEIRTFTPAQREAALAWANEPLPDTDVPRAAG